MLTCTPLPPAQVSLYSFARLSFAKLWCRLNVHASDPGTLLHACATFESLLLAACPSLCLHLANIGLNPVQVALPWMQLGFVGLLEMDQILILWDRVRTIVASTPPPTTP